MPTVSTPFGPLETLDNPDLYPDGAVRRCVPAEACELHAPQGAFVPQYTGNTERRRQLPGVTFHPNSMLRSVPLEEQAVLDTPAGSMPAELFTLYDTGALKRVFPLNGRLSGFWTQEDETALAEPVDLDTPLGSVRAKLVSAYFSPSGALRSLTLWPGEVLDVPVAGVTVPGRVGVSFFDEGLVSSLEPAQPTAVPTPLGDLLAFDPDAVGITGDSNSLRLDRDGSVAALATVSHAFAVSGPDGPVRVAPPLRKSYCDGQTPEPAPLNLVFADGRVRFTADGMQPVEADLRAVQAHPFMPPLPVLAHACGMSA